jgi:hypothetical protein
MQSSIFNRKSSAEKGQVLIYLLIVLVILVFVMGSVFDLNRILIRKMKGHNASDAAALIGAQWQALGLNLIGELNILKASSTSRRQKKMV